ncbi:YD115-like protein [Mya arenaria]|uniref:YD115-like protein n=1 Tax=Mya arenaria TaxID=6604 RepID=A0ABY7FNE7_MYAAR|nr:YD115-like protein [Mya arenaria]
MVDEAGDTTSRRRFRFDFLTGGDGSVIIPASESESIISSPAMGVSGETGPRGPGLTGDLPRPRRSGGEGVSSPEEGGDGVPVIMGALFLCSTGGESRRRGGEGENRLATSPCGGGEGEIDSYESVLLSLCVRRLAIKGGGDGVSDSLIRRILPLNSGEGGGDGEASSRYRVPRSVTPVRVGGERESSRYTGGGEYIGRLSGGGEGLVSSRVSPKDQAWRVLGPQGQGDSRASLETFRDPKGIHLGHAWGMGGIGPLGPKGPSGGRGPKGPTGPRGPNGGGIIACCLARLAASPKSTNATGRALRLLSASESSEKDDLEDIEEIDLERDLETDLEPDECDLDLDSLLIEESDLDRDLDLDLDFDLDSLFLFLLEALLLTVVCELSEPLGEAGARGRSDFSAAMFVSVGGGGRGGRGGGEDSLGGGGGSLGSGGGVVKDFRENECRAMSAWLPCRFRFRRLSAPPPDWSDTSLDVLLVSSFTLLRERVTRMVSAAAVVSACVTSNSCVPSVIYVSVPSEQGDLSLTIYCISSPPLVCNMYVSPSSVVTSSPSPAISVNSTVSMLRLQFFLRFFLLSLLLVWRAPLSHTRVSSSLGVRHTGVSSFIEFRFSHTGIMWILRVFGVSSTVLYFSMRLSNTCVKRCSTYIFSSIRCLCSDAGVLVFREADSKKVALFTLSKHGTSCDEWVHHVINQVHHVINHVHHVINLVHHEINRVHHVINQVHHVINLVPHVINQVHHVINLVHHEINRVHHVINQVHHVINLVPHVINQIHNEINRVHHVINQVHRVINRVHHVINQVHHVINLVHHVINRVHHVTNQIHHVINHVHHVINLLHHVINLLHHVIIINWTTFTLGKLLIPATVRPISTEL